MQRMTPMYDSEGQVYDLPDDKVEDFKAKRGGERAYDYTLPDGKKYSIPESKRERFSEVHPDAQETRRISYLGADGKKAYEDVTTDEFPDFMVRYGKDDKYKADRDAENADWNRVMSGIKMAQGDKSVSDEGRRAVEGLEQGILDYKRDKAAAELRPKSGVEKTAAVLQDLVGGVARTGESLVSGFAKSLAAASSNKYLRQGLIAASEQGDYGDKADPMNGEFADPHKSALGKAADWLDNFTNELFPEKAQSGSVTANVIGAAMEEVAGIAKFALTKTPLLAFSSFGEAYMRQYDMERESGKTPEHAAEAATLRGAVDTATTVAFKKAPVKRILKAYMPGMEIGGAADKAVNGALGKMDFRAASKAIGDGIGKAYLAEMVKTAAEMGVLGGVQGFIDSAMEQEATNKDGHIDWGKAAKDGGVAAWDGVKMAAVLESLPTVQRILAAKRNIAKNTTHLLKTENGRELYGMMNPDGVDEVRNAYINTGTVSRKVAADAALPEMMTKAEREQFARDLLSDRKAARKADVKGPELDEVQGIALGDDITKVVGDDPNTFKLIWNDVMANVESAKELDDPYRREKLINDALLRTADKPRIQRPKPRMRHETEGEPAEKTTEKPVAKDEAAAERPEATAEAPGARSETETGKEKGVATERVDVPSRADGEVVGKAGDESAQKKYTPEEAAALKKKGKAVPEDKILKPEEVEANKETREEKPDETGNGAAEEPAKPEQGVERPEGKPEAPRPLAGEEKGGKAPDEGVVGAGDKAKTAPKVEVSGKTADVTPPDSVEAKIAAMPHGSNEQIKAQRDYLDTEIAKAKAAIEGKFKPKTGRLSKKDKETNAYDRIEGSGDIPDTVNVKVPGDGEITVKNNPHGMKMLDKFASRFKPQKSGLAAEVSAPKPPSITVAKKPKAEQAAKEMEPFVGDETRITLTKPMSDGKFVYATNGKIAVRRPLRKGEKVEGHEAAPVEGVSKFFGDRTDDHTFKVKVSELYPKLVQADLMTGEGPGKGKIELWRGKDGELHVRARDGEGNGYSTDGEAKDSTPLTVIDGKYLRDFIKFAAKNGAEEVEIGFKGGKNENGIDYALRIKGKNVDAVLMPMQKSLDIIKSLNESEAKSDADRMRDYGERAWKDSLSPKLKEELDTLETNASTIGGNKPTEADRDALAAFEEKHGKAKFVADYVKNGGKVTEPKPQTPKSKGKSGGILKQKALGSPEAEAESPLKPEAKGAKEGSKKAQEGKNAHFGWEMGREVELDPSETKSERNPLGQIVVPEEGSVAQSIDREIAADEALAAKGRGKAQGTPPAPAPGSAGNARLNPDYEPESIGSGVKDPVARQQIVDRFKELFGDKAAIRGPNTTGVKKGAAGQYEPKSGNIRSKDPISMRTIPHEIGHHIDASMKRMGIARPPAVRHELIQLGQKLYGSKKPTGGYEAEGFAEMLKYYMQGNDAGLKKEAPEAYKWLTKKFAKADPDTFAKLDEMRDMIGTLQNQSGEQAVRAMRAKDPTLMERMKKSIADTASSFKSGKFYNHWVDKFGFIGQAMKKSGLNRFMDWQGALKRGDVAAANDMFRNNPVVKAKLYGGGGRGRARAEDSYENGLRDLASASRYLTYGDLGIATPGHAANEPLPVPKDIFASFSKAEKDAFQDYAIARIAKEAYLDKGLEFGLTEKEIAPVLRKYANNQKFKDALERYTHYKHGVLHLLVDAGAMSQAQFEAIVAANPIYVKIDRRRDGAELLRNSIMKRGGKVVNKRTGGGQQVEDIFAAGLADDARVFNAAMQADLMRSLVDLGKRGEAAGGVEAEYFTGANWLREVPNAQGNVKFTAEKLRKQITDAMVNQGVAVDKADAKTIFDKLFDDGKDTLSIFKEKPSNGKNGVVSIYDQEGKLHTYELPTNGGDAWAEALFGFTSPDNVVVNQVGKLGKIGSVATGAVRAGATTFNMGFAAANIARDSVDSAIYNEYGTYFPYIGSIQGLVNDMMGSSAAKNYKALALGMGTITGKDRLASAKKADKYVMSKTWYERAWNRGVLHTIADILGHGEDASRIKNFKNAYDWAIKQGLDADVANMLAGCHALDQSLDFGRSGLYGGTVNKFVPFFNAGIQGFEHFIRMHGLRDAEPWQYQNDRKKIAARTVAKGIAAITVPTLLATVFNMTDDDRKRKELERDAYSKFCFMNFGDFRLPVPFENGFMYGSLVKAAIYEAMGDKGALKDCFSIMRKVLSPVDVGTPHEMIRNIAIFSGMADTLENKRWNGRPIVPEHMMHGASKVPSYMWANPDTSKTARALGKFFSNFVDEDNKIASPAIIENFFDVHTGGLFSKVVKTIEGMSTGGIDTKRPHTWPVVGRFFHDPTKSRIMGDFYERREQLIMRKNSGESSVRENNELKSANKVAERLTELRKRAKKVEDDKKLSVTERNDRLEEITVQMQNLCRNWNERWGKQKK